MKVGNVSKIICNYKTYNIQYGYYHKNFEAFVDFHAILLIFFHEYYFTHGHFFVNICLILLIILP